MRRGCINDTALLYFVTFKLWQKKADQVKLMNTLKDIGVVTILYSSNYNSPCVFNSRICIKILKQHEKSSDD